MRISENDLITMASAYVKDGNLKKWRFDNLDKSHIDARLNVKFYSKEKLTSEELDYISSLKNVVHESNDAVELINFTGVVRKY
ncbi:hypothetical protein [Bacillus atrophaeus]|uniref:hypothetical protein n=1 Tax=Bacillus atrophaeus TaxID=1452 RepID=UPI002E24CACC|nr:hypothetical protein [Bacillus atrophaeus]